MTSNRRRKIFATLGPAGSNHDLNTARYIRLHGLDAEIRYIENFFDAVDQMRTGEGTTPSRSAPTRTWR